MDRDSYYQRAKVIFDGAVELSGQDRIAYLERNCGTDPTMRGYVEKLLAADARATNGALRPFAPLADFIGELDLSGRTLGRYRIVRTLGAGGMGTVYEAVQELPRRMVALKVLRYAMASDEARRRFEYEVEILGRLRHTSIAQIHEAGTFEIGEHHVPFYAMELVSNAKSITDFARERALTIPARLTLFATACEAVQHGHQHGVIHRDLKPANILVDETGQPKVIDFGVARSTNSDVTITMVATQFGELIGTLQYMSPEQCNGDPSRIDTRSDVYSLGVVLYELLSGVPPYTLKDLTISAVVQAVCDRAVEPPSAHESAICKDLDAVVLMALHKNREHRYSTAGALAVDLKNVIEGQPTRARLPGRWMRLTTRIARHPILTTTAACALLVLVTLGSMGFSWLYFVGKPHRIAHATFTQTAKLVSRGGATIYEWDAGQSNSIVHAELVAAPAEYDGQRVALVAFDKSASPDEVHGELHAFGVNAPATRLWSTARFAIQAPPGKQARPERLFHVTHALVADMIQDSPGPEVLLVQRKRPFTDSVLRVFDMAGELRFEAWHDGSIGTVTWLAEPRRLLLTTVDPAMWAERGLVTESSTNRYPAVVFALDVRDGCIDRERWINLNGHVSENLAAWYKWLGPYEDQSALGQVMLDLDSDIGTFSRTSHAGLAVRGELDPTSGVKPLMHLIIDADGREVSRLLFDDYREARLRGAVPDDSHFRLIDHSLLPSRIPGNAGE